MMEIISCSEDKKKITKAKQLKIPKQTSLVLEIADQVKWKCFTYTDTFCLKFRGKLLNLFFNLTSQKHLIPIIILDVAYDVSQYKAL